MKDRIFEFEKKTLSASRDGLGCRECEVTFRDLHGNSLIRNMSYEDWAKCGVGSKIKLSIEII